MTGTFNRIDRGFRKSFDQKELAEHHEQKAAGLARQLKKTIFSDDTDAVEQLEKKIAELEKSQSMMVAGNKILRSKKKSQEEKIVELVKLGMSEKVAKSLFEPNFLGSKGFASFELTNNSANIRRYKQRLQDVKSRLERQKAAADTANGVAITYDGGGWARVTFTEKPDWETRQTLKKAGFFWRNGCWNGAAKDLPIEIADMAL